MKFNFHKFSHCILIFLMIVLPSCDAHESEFDTSTIYRMEILVENGDWSIFSVNRKNELYCCYQVSNGEGLHEIYKLDTIITTRLRSSMMDIKLINKVVQTGSKKGDKIDGSRVIINFFNDRGILLKSCYFSNGYSDAGLNEFVESLETATKNLQGFSKLEPQFAMQTLRKLESRKTIERKGKGK